MPDKETFREVLERWATKWGSTPKADRPPPPKLPFVTARGGDVDLSAHSPIVETEPADQPGNEYAYTFLDALNGRSPSTEGKKRAMPDRPLKPDNTRYRRLR